MQFIDLHAQYLLLKSRIDRRIQAVLSHGQYIMGPEVQELEERLSEYVGVKHCITCANGTDALTLSLMALEIQEGDAIFCPTFTFFATAEVIALHKATPVFVDSDMRTFNICPIDLEKQIKKVIREGKWTARAIIAVDLFGLPADYLQIERIAEKYGLKVIEDAAQGFGGEINKKRAGSFGDIATTSFFPAKPLGCYGDGGAIFTNNDEYAELLRSYRIHGKGKNKYDNVRIGVNSRLDTIQAAILLEKFAIFPEELESRNASAQRYNNELGASFQVPYVPYGYLSSWAQYTVVVKDRSRQREKCKRHGIPTMIYYETCMHQQTAFRRLGFEDADFPIASKLAKQVLSLPIRNDLNLEFLTDEKI